MALLDLDFIKRLISGQTEEQEQPVTRQRPIEAITQGPQESVRDQIVPAQTEQATAEKPSFMQRFMGHDGETPEEAAKREALGLALMSGGGAMMVAGGPSLTPTNFMTALGAGTSQFANAYAGQRDGMQKNAVERKKQQKAEHDAEMDAKIAAVLNGQPTPEMLMTVAESLMAAGDRDNAIKMVERADTLRNSMANDGMVLGPDGKWVNADGRVDASAEIKRSDAAATQQGTEDTIRTNDKRIYDEQIADPGIVKQQVDVTGQIERAKPTPDVKNFEYGQDNPLFRQQELEDKAASRNQTIINTGDKAENAFGIEAAKKQAESFAKAAEEYTPATEGLAVIGQLRESLKNNPGGFQQGIKSWASDWGVQLTKDAPDIEYAKAIIARLIPQQRIPGSGASTDKDDKRFEDALPKLMNTPGGNELVLNQMEALALYKQQSAIIANDALNGDITRKEATQKVQELGDPYKLFKEYQKANKLADPEKVKDVPNMTINKAGVVSISTVEEWNALAPGTRVQWKGQGPIKTKP